jgi:hypothetical protein
MSFPIVKCPTCGKTAHGTCEMIPGIAFLEEDDGVLEHASETDVDWNGQVTRHCGGAIMFWCRDCGEFAVEVEGSKYALFAKLFTEDGWREEVASGDTRLGYDEWLDHKIEENDR